MTSIEAVHLQTPDPAAAEAFYANAFGLNRLVHPRDYEASSSGFRGYTLSLIVSQPASVDAFLDAALQAGATPLKPAKKQFWGGYSAVLRAPDGAVWKVATDAKKNTGPVSRQIDAVVLLLGVADMRASKGFYVDRGLTVAKSFGSKYIEFDAKSNVVKLGLYKRRALAKDANVTPEGSGSHRIAIVNDAGSFIDPDGFVWQHTSA